MFPVLEVLIYVYIPFHRGLNLRVYSMSWVVIYMYIPCLKGLKQRVYAMS